MLEVRGIVKRFGGIRALSGVDFSVGAGELVGIIGPNGSGKTTVFNVITGIYRPDDGTVSMEGRPIAGLSPHRVTAAGIARTFQNIRLFRNLSVLDNVRVAFHPHAPYGPVPALLRLGAFREGERQLREKAEEFLALVSLEGRSRELAGHLPYGDQRRLEIARALASRPKLLLLDEPAAGMNPKEVGGLMDFLREIRQRLGISLLVIEHRMRLVMGVCERILVMDFGEIIARGAPEEIRDDPRVVEAYLGRGSVSGGPG